MQLLPPSFADPHIVLLLNDTMGETMTTGSAISCADNRGMAAFDSGGAMNGVKRLIQKIGTGPIGRVFWNI